jgi:hypothetical protein
MVVNLFPNRYGLTYKHLRNLITPTRQKGPIGDDLHETGLRSGNVIQKCIQIRQLMTVQKEFMYSHTQITGGVVRGGVVVEALRYKPEGREFNSRWCHWIFSFT